MSPAAVPCMAQDDQCIRTSILAAKSGGDSGSLWDTLLEGTVQVRCTIILSVCAASSAACCGPQPSRRRNPAGAQTSPGCPCTHGAGPVGRGGQALAARGRARRALPHHAGQARNRAGAPLLVSMLPALMRSLLRSICGLASAALLAGLWQAGCPRCSPGHPSTRLPRCSLALHLFQELHIRWVTHMFDFLSVIDSAVAGKQSSAGCGRRQRPCTAL